jgi:hypothetical protein
MLEIPDDVPPCPRCQGTLRLVSSIRSGQSPHLGSDEPELDIILLGLASKGVSVDVFTFDCPRCGRIYLSQKLPGQDDGRDRDSLVGAPKRLSPRVDRSAGAIPEPDDDLHKTG